MILQYNQFSPRSPSIEKNFFPHQMHSRAKIQLHFIQEQRTARDKGSNSANEKANGDLRPVHVVRFFLWAKDPKVLNLSLNPYKA